jgi:hypothetical protein
MTLFGGQATDIAALLAVAGKGDEITIEGTTTDYNGLFEINAPFPYYVKTGSPGVPAVIGVTAADFADYSGTAEGLESEVVHLTKAVTFSATGNFVGGTVGSNYTVTEVGTGLTMVVRISTNVPPSEGTMIHGTPIPTGPVIITGIFNQSCFPYTPPCYQWYQLLPRNLEDIVAAPTTGACCQLDGTCAVTTQALCTGGAIWRGAGTNCSPNLCPGYCATGRADVNNDGVCNGLDIQKFVDCVVVPGLTQACACADMDNDGDDDMDDVAPFVTALLAGACLPPP